jgi:hypothetical protein
MLVLPFVRSLFPPLELLCVAVGLAVLLPILQCIEPKLLLH